MNEPKVVGMERLRTYVEQISLRTGLSESDARLLADTLITAEAWGHKSHGVLRLPWYSARIHSGAIQAEKAPVVEGDMGAIVQINGHDSLGQRCAQFATETVISRAKSTGVAVATVRNSNHFGTAAYFTRQIAEAGLVGILLTTSSPAMAAWGGAEKLMGTNPWSIAAPAGSYGPVVMDMANTSVARGKIYAASARNEDIPTSWAADRNGVPTSDPQAALEGFMLPTGGPKGYVTSFMIDMLAGILANALPSPDVIGPYDPTGKSGCGHMFIAIDVSAFGDVSDYDSRAEAYVDRISESRPASGTEGVLTPGEWEMQNLKRARANGLTIPAEVMDELRELANTHGVESDWSRP